ncbi:radical SAM protein [Geomonas sp. RF6]|uniref:B12-binding domain-containing radical SAM protein n=1 Tax=Geomonas sp. RF6 TaxID=2897342 RepID=UPI001E357DE3|nr:radical SAM protein [Geomonas sp. RF6]UFS68687.1 radical SAM protein [Geomonas sp. RF6]
MKVLLAYKSDPAGAQDPFTSLLPVGLVSLHGVLLKDGHEATLANFSRTGWGKIRSHLLRVKPQVVGISQFTHNRHESLRLARLVKELLPGAFVILGGPHATHTAEATLARNVEVDCVVLGEGEGAMMELLSVLSGKGDLSSVAGIACRAGAHVRCTSPREPIADLDALPFPGEISGERIGVDYRRQLEFVITSRGCPASCLFCSSPLFWGRGVRFRSPASIVAEIRSIRDRYGLIYFSFRDDTFTVRRERVLEFCRLLEEERLHIMWNCQSRVNAVDQEMVAAMKRAGCECIQFGVESGSPAMLKALGKRITPADVERAARMVRAVGINMSVYLITGIPGEGEEDLQQTLSLVERIRPQDGQVSPLVYYPGTELFGTAVQEKRVSELLFEAAEGEGFPLRSDPFVERSRSSLLKGLEKGGARGRFGAKDFAAHHRATGYSAVTQMLMGEALEEEGDRKGAEKAYREIVKQQPEHPWGWLLLAALHESHGEYRQAKEGYQRLLALVPKHLPALAALGELSMSLGERRDGERYLALAAELEKEGGAGR